MCLPVVSDVSGENHVMVFEYGNVILYTINNINNANNLVVIDGMPFDGFLPIWGPLEYYFLEVQYLNFAYK